MGCNKEWDFVTGSGMKTMVSAINTHPSTLPPHTHTPHLLGQRPHSQKLLFVVREVFPDDRGAVLEEELAGDAAHQLG